MEYREKFPWYLEFPSYFLVIEHPFIILSMTGRGKEIFLSFLHLILSIESIDLVQNLKACYAVKIVKHS